MIVLDTNQLKHASFPHGAVLGMLRKIAALHGRQLALPEMTVTEHVAHHQHDTEADLNAARKALTALGKSFGQDLASAIDTLAPEQAADRRRTALEGVFEVLPTPAGAAEEALRREANRIPPAEQRWMDAQNTEVKARGARDVAIWLTLLDAASRLDGDIWFVTLDQDFGRTDFHPVLRDEARDRLGDGCSRLRLLPGGIDELLRELATPTSPPADLSKLLDSPVAFHAVTIALTNEGLLLHLMRHVTPATPVAGGNLHLHPERIKRSSAYTVGDSTWVSAQVNWQGFQVLHGYGGEAPMWDRTANFHIETTVLLEIHDGLLQSAEVTSATPITAVAVGSPQIGGAGWTISLPTSLAPLHGPGGPGWAAISPHPDDLGPAYQAEDV
ncbi:MULTISPECIES: PIN domain-containing protein [unclassified Streptomyces]|uniref:PIN domain-containing protein n=1 Tax=Streptomyces sp. NPDC058812 TaxID=3346639 RepID=UPI0036CDC8B0